MTTIHDLNRSISEMSDEELLGRLKELRTARRIPIEKPTKKAKSKTKKVTNPTALVGSMTPEMKAQLLKELEEML